jgi:hypothetical protein
MFGAAVGETAPARGRSKSDARTNRLAPRRVCIKVRRKTLEIGAAVAFGLSALAIAIHHSRTADAVTVDGDPGGSAVVDGERGGQEPTADGRAPKIEVVFALDTTGSMGGLIEGAKAKVWFIANQLASGNPTPQLEIGLVGYRDVGDAYVTRQTPLSADLDQVYGELIGFAADGGGDGPEHVNRALADAIRNTQWSDDALKIIFLVGDAPPHDDYDDGLNSSQLASEARGRGIVINTIRCGNDLQTDAAWKTIAQLANGRYTSIAQDGAMTTIATPFDDQLRQLNAQLVDTALGYGSRDDQERVLRKMSRRKGMSAAVAADAASFAAKAPQEVFSGEEDLVGAVAEGRVAVENLDAGDLPAQLRGLSDGEQKRFIASKQREREQLKHQIRELSTQRDAYLSEQARDDNGFDAHVVDMLRDQARAAGVEY